MHENARLSGYQILVDGKPLGGLRNPDIEQMVINNLVPGTQCYLETLLLSFCLLTPLSWCP